MRGKVPGSPENARIWDSRGHEYMEKRKKVSEIQERINQTTFDRSSLTRENSRELSRISTIIILKAESKARERLASSRRDSARKT